jgi:cobalt-zinc-cadmium efflux system membrane fusion protein
MKTLLLSLFVLTAALFVPGCSREQKVSAANAPVIVEPPSDPNSFSVEKPQEFELVEAVARSVRDDIQSNGVVAPDVSRTVPVMSLSGGRVIEINARLGDDVKKGQLLLRINSADLASAYADYHKALADEVVSRKALERAHALLEHGAMALKDVEAAENAEQKAVVDVKNTAERIRILGGDAAHPTTVLEVNAPVSGTIVEQNIQAAGGVKSLDNSPNLFTIADLSSVWILCDVYENNLSQVRVGDIAEVRLNAYPDRLFKARVSNISRVLDPATRTAKVRLELPNTGNIMRPGMFATARFFSQGTHNRVLLPSTAILRLHDKDWVFRPTGGNQFRRVEVQGAETTTDGNQFVSSGVQSGDRVVKNALQFSSTVEK